MLLCDINPHIRHASSGMLRLAAADTSSLDCRLFYLHEGTLIFTLDGESHEIGDGTLLVWQSGRRYRFDMENAVRAAVINFDFTQSRREQPQARPFPADRLNSDDVIRPPEFTDAPELSGLILRRGQHTLESRLDELVTEFHSPHRFGKESASAILKQILIEAVRESEETSRSERTVRHITAFIEENYAKPITNRDVAEHVRYHEYYVNKLIREHTGMTLHRYLLSVRIRNAARMLFATDYPASKIAELCGFATPAHFAQVFGDQMGMSPSEYRRGQRMI